MGKRFRRYVTPCGALQSVITHGGSGIQRRIDVCLVDHVPFLRGVSPNAGETIGLQFDPDRGPPGLQYTQKFLHMVADLMGDHISLRELTRCAESPFELIKELEIQVDLLVAGAIERTGGSLSNAAARTQGMAKKIQFGVMIGYASLGGEHSIPVLLHVIKDEGNKMKFPVARPAWRGLRQGDGARYRDKAHKPKKALEDAA